MKRKARELRTLTLTRRRKRTASAGGFATQISFLAAGTAASGTTSCTPAYPAVSDGNGLILAVGSKIRDAIVDTPSGWHRFDETMDHVTGSGSDVGEIKQTLFWKEADGTETGTVTVTSTGGNSLNSVIYSFAKDPTAYWGVASSGAGFQTAGTAYSVTAHHNIASRANDLVFVITSTNENLYTYSTQAISQSGVTFSTVSAEVGEYATAQGNNQKQFASVFTVTTGSDTAAKMVYTATASGTAANNPLGTTHFIQLRQHSTAQALVPSGLRIWRASEIVDTTYSGDGSAIWDGMRTSVTTTGTGWATQFSIESFGGRPTLKFKQEMLDSSNYVMRSEVALPVPLYPSHPIGTQIIHELRVETPSDAPAVYREWDMVQNHTGAAPGGPWPMNSPIIYLGWAYAGQTGWTGGGTAIGGEFIVVGKAGGTRHKYPQVMWAASSTYLIVYHIKFDYASGDPCFKVGIRNKDTGVITWIHEDYTNKTVWESGDEVTDGAAFDVGGIPKMGIYSHSITSGTVAANSIAAGNSGYTIHVPATKMIIQHPTDDDYIGDVTDNTNAIYNYVDTSSE
jgi:hypothetical protein